MQIRPASADDLPAVAAIYAREAREGHATFDLEGRPMQLWEDKLGAGDHFLVAEHEEAVIGYATS
ncbi:MAG: N-acetyltransferase family protein, partial [Terrabacter sp.]